MDAVGIQGEEPTNTEPPKPLEIISLGAGVQSSTMALMAAVGELAPMPDCAIFADTHSEPKAVYDWLDWLEKQLPFPVYRVSKGNLGEEAVILHTTASNGKKYTKYSIPAWIVDDEGQTGFLMRQCTTSHKILVIHKKLRELVKERFGKKAGGPSDSVVRVRQWIGISRDEIQRMKPAREPWIENVWPLVFEKGFTRGQCLAWMEARGYPKPPRSSCVFCPYKRDSEWREMKEQEPDAFEYAVEWEKRFQDTIGQVTGIRGIPYLHNSFKPLGEVDFEIKDDGQLDLFGNECEGMCGV